MTFLKMSTELTSESSPPVEYEPYNHYDDNDRYETLEFYDAHDNQDDSARSQSSDLLAARDAVPPTPSESTQNFLQQAANGSSDSLQSSLNVNQPINRTETITRPVTASTSSVTAEVVDLISDDEDGVEVEDIRPNVRRAKLASRSRKKRIILDESHEEEILLLSSPATDILKPKTEENPKAQSEPGPDDNSSYERLKDNLKCLICLDLFYKPVTLVPCSHVFCAGCYSSWNKPTCPSCRQPVQMVMDAPKNITNMVDDFLEKFPEQKKTKQAMKELDKNDKLKRGVLLNRTGAASVSTSTTSSRVNQMTLSDAIESFVSVTGLSRQQAFGYVQGAAVRGLSLQDAVDFYFRTAGGGS